MLERVGYPVAMDNAIPEVKAIAKLVTDTNEHSGWKSNYESFN